MFQCERRTVAHGAHAPSLLTRPARAPSSADLRRRAAQGRSSLGCEPGAVYCPRWIAYLLATVVIPLRRWFHLGGRRHTTARLCSLLWVSRLLPPTSSHPGRRGQCPSPGNIVQGSKWEQARATVRPASDGTSILLPVTATPFASCDVMTRRMWGSRGGIGLDMTYLRSASRKEGEIKASPTQYDTRL